MEIQTEDLGAMNLVQEHCAGRARRNTRWCGRWCVCRQPVGQRAPVVRHPLWRVANVGAKIQVVVRSLRSTALAGGTQGTHAGRGRPLRHQAIGCLLQAVRRRGWGAIRVVGTIVVEFHSPSIIKRTASNALPRLHTEQPTTEPA
jgi:hypothetical protein